MKFSENWLRELVPVSLDRAALCHGLTMAGLEVEGVEPIGAALAGVVVGEIVACEPHPNADKLRVCRVSTGQGEPLQIVCGAPNARTGLKAPLATVGAALPGGIAIKQAALRGVDSFGMLCSAKELAIDADASGLMELPADAVPGTPIATQLGLPDAAIEIKLTPNRPDCLSVHGLARDAAAVFSTPLRLPAMAPVTAASTHERVVALQAGADCPRYAGRLIEGVDAKAKTPFWIAERLRRSGIRPISLLVDVTQYVMIELGQPMHAFDADTLQGAVSVRRARAGESLVLLDGSDVTLDAECLVIADGADAARAIALAGIMGGQATRVTDATTNVFLEAAHFAPTAISGRARKFGMHTDASHRFERGVDPELPRLAIERATRLILDAGGGTAGPVTEAVNAADLPRRDAVILRRGRVRRLLGVGVADAEVERILQALGLRYEHVDKGWRALAPSYRFDIAIEEDLIEEIARVHGYDAIPTTMPAGEIRVAAPSETRVDEATLRRQLVAREFREAVTFAFLDGAELARWQLDDGAIALANPLAADLGVMRTSLLPGLVAALRGNRRHQQERVRLFELGRVFRFGADRAPQETPRVAGVACGEAASLQWGVARRALDFYDIKGDIESLFALCGAAGEFEVAAGASEPFLHPGRSAEVRRHGARVGVVGALHPRLARALDLDGDVYVFEFDLAPLLARAVPRAGVVARFPSVRRDLSFELPETVNFITVRNSVSAAVGPTLKEIFVFDRYSGPNLGSGVKSLAIGLILQDDYRTLTDADADACIGRAVAALERDCQARLRG